MVASLFAIVFWHVTLTSVDLTSSPDPQFVEIGVADVELGDNISGTRFISRYGKGTVNDDGYIHHRYLNGSGSEVLDLILYPGDVKNTFMKLRVRQAKPSDIRGLSRLSWPAFASLRGITIGLGREALVALLGPPSSIAERNRQTILSYYCRSRRRCPILKKENMPSNRARYVFVADKLVDFSLGFPYP